MNIKLFSSGPGLMIGDYAVAHEQPYDISFTCES